jgi:hypothetical protein
LSSPINIRYVGHKTLFRDALIYSPSAAS